MSNNVDNFIAGLHGFPDADTYHTTHHAWLARLDEFETPFPVTTEAEYRKADAVRRMLSGLSCYTFNTRHPLNDRVWALESTWAATLVKFNRRLLIKDPDARLVARYLLWSFVFRGPDPRAAFVLARQHGLLRKCSRTDGRGPLLCVIGLDRAVGDNVFTVDRRGREHRRYGRTIGRQAFPVCRTLPWSDDDAEIFLATIPELDDSYRVTHIGDHKHAARGSAFRREAQRKLLALLDAVAPEAMGPAAQAPAAAAPPPQARPSATQLDLLAAA